ncbi:uncharacterized protein PHALS_13304 [Plasmopara halstedii]|uniref:Uncharacterized protein n=1 Tax=Plasmopara halstedii TaxID=4781 RepID=A0A0P1APB1_PLAHL|nr:uncharacterized protein PHALS_13304 [Plasmopara halstedii]CEG43086.1 hypothetical protein PHALS_13304 [Plasmopara halstedii]|eukprot:XP_024579455.1 hypothetical protein PHALS_13304 [Plasmopara halstedii]
MRDSLLPDVLNNDQRQGFEGEEERKTVLINAEQQRAWMKGQEGGLQYVTSNIARDRQPKCRLSIAVGSMKMEQAPHPGLSLLCARRQCTDNGACWVPSVRQGTLEDKTINSEQLKSDSRHVKSAEG